MHALRLPGGFSFLRFFTSFIFVLMLLSLYASLQAVKSNAANYSSAQIHFLASGKGPPSSSGPTNNPSADVTQNDLILFNITNLPSTDPHGYTLRIKSDTGDKKLVFNIGYEKDKFCGESSLSGNPQNDPQNQLNARILLNADKQPEYSDLQCTHDGVALFIDTSRIDPGIAQKTVYTLSIESASAPGTDGGGVIDKKYSPVDSSANQFTYSVSPNTINSSTNITIQTPNTVTWGDKNTLTISSIPLNFPTTYTISATGITDTSFSPQTRKFSVKNGTCGDSLSDDAKLLADPPPSDAGICTKNADGLTATLSIPLDFSKVPIPSERTVSKNAQIRLDKYQFSFTGGNLSNPKTSETSVTYASTFTISANSADVVAEAAASGTTGFYSNSGVTISTTNCLPNSDIAFTWLGDGKDHAGSASSDGDGKASVTPTFQNDDTKPLLESVTAICKDTGATAHTDFYIYNGTGETATIAVSSNAAGNVIAENKPFTIVIGGLDPANCYYVRIATLSKDFPPEYNEISKDDYNGNKSGNYCSNIDEFPFLASGVSGQGNGWNRSTTLDIGTHGLPNGLKKGIYAAVLMRAASDPGFLAKAAKTTISGFTGATGAFVGFMTPGGIIFGTAGGAVGAEAGQSLGNWIFGDGSDENVANAIFCVGGTTTSDCSTLPEPGKPPCDNLLASKFDAKNLDTTKCIRVNTALGPISTDPAGFVSNILGILLSLSGGIALLLIIRSGYQMMTSSGNPEAIQEARERITSAIVGLLFIIFSLVLLEVIGVDILHIPGFSH